MPIGGYPVGICILPTFGVPPLLLPQNHQFSTSSIVLLVSDASQFIHEHVSTLQTRFDIVPHEC
eukprot:scaffold2569_cov197-Alexandrium_tamarense.AAC.14